jgi:P27 family predicted phage terminase small subunit
MEPDMAGVAGRSGGRNAKTVQEHQQRGSFRDDRHGSYTNPDPPKGQPKQPKSLKGDALAEWKRMIQRMEDSGTLSKVDDAALFQYVCLFGETEAIVVQQAHTADLIEKLEDAIAGTEDRPGLTEGDLVNAIREITKLKQLDAKYTSDIRQGRMAIRQYLVEFGMTPAARSRVKSAKADVVKDAWDGLVN